MEWWPFGVVVGFVLAALAAIMAPDGIGAILAPALAFYSVFVAVTGMTSL